jgi:hypothetical protein
VVCAGRRSGKSTLSQLQVIAWANENIGKYWIVAPTYKQAKQIHWEGVQHYVPQKLITKKNEVELSITLTNGSVIELKGAENPDALRGVKLRGLVIDEIASIRNWGWLWSEVLRPTLTDFEAPVLFISTPRGYNHFYELWNMGNTSREDYVSWRFTSYDNPYIPKEEIDHAKEELTEDTFAQEYLADFRRHTGIAHKPWDRSIHLLDEFDVPNTWQFGRGFDFGELHFTGTNRFAIDQDDNWFIDSCYLNNTANIKGHAEVILAEDYNKGFIPKWGDPSGKQWMLDFQMHGVIIQPANKEVGQGFRGWVEYCVEKVNERLKPIPGHIIRLPNGKIIENAPKLFVIKNGKTDKFVAQIEMLSWKETATGDLVPILEETGDPTGGHFDLMAALRYFVVSYKKHQSINFADLPKYQPRDSVIGI